MTSSVHDQILMAAKSRLDRRMTIHVAALAQNEQTYEAYTKDALERQGFVQHKPPIAVPLVPTQPTLPTATARPSGQNQIPSSTQVAIAPTNSDIPCGERLVADRPAVRKASVVIESGEGAESQLVERLIHVSDAWDELQNTRARDAVYRYLETAFVIVKHYQRRHRIDSLIRAAYTFADLPLDINANPFAAVIRCTSKYELHQ
jgi:hypothetical protein